MSRILLFVGGLLALLSVALGAMGTHSLQKHLTEHMLDVFKTGANYQLTQALGLILMGILLQLNPENKKFGLAGSFLIAGVLIFSGSLYAYSLSGVLFWAMITPLGGLCFLTGWAIFLFGVANLKKPEAR